VERAETAMKRVEANMVMGVLVRSIGWSVLFVDGDGEDGGDRWRYLYSKPTA